MSPDSDPREVRVIRRVSKRLLPFLMLLYLVAFLDRVNIGFASLQMNQDIGLGATAFGIGAGIFFFGYTLFEVPSNLLMNRFGARAWIARIMVSWGIVSIGMAFVSGPLSFYVLRFLLGVAEAGFFPGIILYLSQWVPRSHRAGATAVFMAAAPLSTAIGSPLSSALLQVDGLLGLKGWQWLFVLEAVPAVILGVIVLRFLSDRPSDAAWLAPEDRAWLTHRLAQDGQGSTAAVHSPWKALRDPRVLALGVVYFGTSAGLYTIGIWSPQIVAGFGLGTLANGFVNAIPGVLAILSMLYWSRHSDRSAERRWHIFLPCLVAALGLFLATQATGVVMVVSALTFVSVGVAAAKPPLWAFGGQFLGGAGAAAGFAAINSIGNLGGFFGPAMIGWLKERTGSFDGGLLCVAFSLAVSAILVLLLEWFRD